MKRARIGSENCPQCEAVLSGCEGVVQCSMCDLKTVKGFDRECPVRTSTPAQKHGQRPPNNECIVGFPSSSALDVDDDETIIGGVMVYSNIGSGLNVSITDREEP